jgi:hypothetical protein
MRRIIGLLFLLNCWFLVHAKAKPGPFALSGGCIITAPQYILFNNLPAAITATGAGGGSCSSYNYQWQQSADNVYFTDIPGATGQNLSFTVPLPNSPATTYFQRRTVCDNEVAYTGSAVVNMIEKFFYNVEKTGSFIRNSCASGAIPATYLYVVPARKYASPLNQEDADAKAQKDVADSGQYYANNNAVCTWYSVQKSGVYTRNNCGTGGSGGSYTYVVNAQKYPSNISQADADAKAQKEVNDSGQAYANRLATCTWSNAATSGTYTKNNCPDNTTPTSVVYNVGAGKYPSTISQADANAKAQKEVTDSGQVYANRNGVCQNLFIKIRSDGTDPGTYNLIVKNSAGVEVLRQLMDGNYPFAYALATSNSYTVTIGCMNQMYIMFNGGSQTVINNSSVSWTGGGPINIQVSKTPLYYSAYASGNFIKICPSGYTGNTVTYPVYGGKYISPYSQADADFKAQKEVSDSGQAYAQRVGTCTPANLVSITLTNYFPGRNAPASMSVSFIKDGVVAQTSYFSDASTGSVPITLPAGSYTMRFSSPNSPVNAPLGWSLRPQFYYYSLPGNSTTVTTGTITFVYGTAYTIQADANL